MEQNPFRQSLQMAESLGLDVSPAALFAGFVFSVVGYYLFKEGRKREKTGVLWVGVVMMIYPVLINGALKLWMVGLGLSAVAYFLWTRDDA